MLYGRKGSDQVVKVVKVIQGESRSVTGQRFRSLQGEWPSVFCPGLWSRSFGCQAGEQKQAEMIVDKQCWIRKWAAPLRRLHENDTIGVENDRYYCSKQTKTQSV